MSEDVGAGDAVPRAARRAPHELLERRQRREELLDQPRVGAEQARGFVVGGGERLGGAGVARRLRRRRGRAARPRSAGARRATGRTRCRWRGARRRARDSPAAEPRVAPRPGRRTTQRNIHARVEAIKAEQFRCSKVPIAPFAGPRGSGPRRSSSVRRLRRRAASGNTSFIERTPREHAERRACPPSRSRCPSTSPGSRWRPLISDERRNARSGHREAPMTSSFPLTARPPTIALMALPLGTVSRMARAPPSLASSLAGSTAVLSR